MDMHAPNGEPARRDRYRCIAEEIAELWEQPPPPSVLTGIAPLDRTLEGGLMSESMTVLVAGTGRGKTGLVIQIVLGWLSQGYAVLFIETEMSKRQVAARFLAQVKRHAWRDVYLMEPEKRAGLVELARKSLNGLCVWRWQQGQDLGDVIGGFIEVHGRRALVVLDQLSDLARAQKAADMRFATGTVTAEIKALAEKHKTVILAVSQTARTVTSDRDKTKRGRDFEGAAKDAGEVEADASTLLYLVADPCPRNGTAPARLHVAKSRGGPCNEVIGLRFHGALGCFEPDVTAALTDDEKRVLACIGEQTKQSEFVGVAKLKTAVGMGQDKLERLLLGLQSGGLVCRDSKRGIRLLKPERP